MVVIGAVWFLNVPFYGGSGVGADHAWRMEHGRLKVWRSEGAGAETLYIDVNHEGLRWWPEMRHWQDGSWMVAVPLWAPMVVCCVWGGWAWSRKRGVEGGGAGAAA